MKQFRFVVVKNGIKTMSGWQDATNSICLANECARFYNAFGGEWFLEWRY